MLLRDSEVARQVRVYLLGMEYLARTQPVDNSVHTDTVSSGQESSASSDVSTSTTPAFNDSKAYETTGPPSESWPPWTP